MIYLFVRDSFNPLHCGHLAYFKAAKQLSSTLIVIVNNDIQVWIKGGGTCFDLDSRMEIVSAIKYVNMVVPSIDQDYSVPNTLESLLKDKPEDLKVCFVNSGDRNLMSSNEKEVAICDLYGINMEYLSLPKIDSSSRIRSLRH